MGFLKLEGAVLKPLKVHILPDSEAPSGTWYTSESFKKNVIIWFSSDSYNQCANRVE